MSHYLRGRPIMTRMMMLAFESHSVVVSDINLKCRQSQYALTVWLHKLLLQINCLLFAIYSILPHSVSQPYLTTEMLQGPPSEFLHVTI